MSENETPQPEETEETPEVAPEELGSVPDDPSFWPNQKPGVDGVTPVNEVDQSPDLFEDDDLDQEMEV